MDAKIRQLALRLAAETGFDLRTTERFLLAPTQVNRSTRTILARVRAQLEAAPVTPEGA